MPYKLYIYIFFAPFLHGVILKRCG